jgi:hypothetical protein
MVQHACAKFELKEVPTIGAGHAPLGADWTTRFPLTTRNGALSTLAATPTLSMGPVVVLCSK